MMEHDTDMGEALPMRQSAYRLPEEKGERMEKKVEYLLQHGWAESSCSGWASPCMLAGKADGSDFRKVNAITKPDCYPSPCIDNCIDQVGGAKFVSRLDLLKGYW